MTSSINLAKPFEADDWLDIDGLIGEVARRHNILISPDDPIFATITLNDLVLARALERQQAALIAAQDQIVATTAQQIASVQRLCERLITAASEHVVRQTHNAIDKATEQNKNAVTAELRKAQQIVEKAKASYFIIKWSGVAIASATLLVSFIWVMNI